MEGVMEVKLLNDPPEMELLLDIGVEVDVGLVDVGEVLETSRDTLGWKRWLSLDSVIMPACVMTQLFIHLSHQHVCECSPSICCTST